MNIANPMKPLQPSITLRSSYYIWNQIWSNIKATRLDRPHLVSCPRLRALDINVGSFRRSHNYIGPYDWEQSEQIRFRVRRSHKEDEANEGLANVSCLELEKLEARLGTGPVNDRLQARLIQEVRERAKGGLQWKRDPTTETFPENSLKTMLMFEGAGPLLTQEGEWATRISTEEHLPPDQRL